MGARTLEAGIQGLDKRALFREVNDRIREVNQQLAIASDEFEALCECGRDDCRIRVVVSFSTFDQVRNGHGRFLVAPGHEEPELEEVVAEETGFRIVVRDLTAAPVTLSEPGG